MGYAVTLCVAVAVLEGWLSAEGLPTWYAGLAKPWWHVPMWGFVLVAVAVYLMDGWIAYRLCVVRLTAGNRAIGLTALAVVMMFNAFWNYALLASEDLSVAVLGLFAFLAPLIILQVVLAVYDRRSAVVFGVYVAWVVLYDIPLYYAMWQMNSV